MKTPKKIDVAVLPDGQDIYILCLCALGRDLCAITQYQKMWLCPTSYSAFDYASIYMKEAGATLDDFALFYCNTRLLVTPVMGSPLFNCAKLDIKKEFSRWMKSR